MHPAWRRLTSTRWRMANALNATRIRASIPGRPKLRGRAVDVTRPFEFGEREVMLTFDDGPNGETTPAILRTLELFDVSALFFLVGTEVARLPELVPRIVALGHVAGSHTYTHPHMPQLTPEAARVELLEGHGAVDRALGGTAPHLFRFPYVDHSPELDAMVDAEGFRAFGVDISCKDWMADGPSEVIRIGLESLAETERGFILLHDIHRRTADALPRLLAALIERDYSVITPTAG